MVDRAARDRSEARNPSASAVLTASRKAGLWSGRPPYAEGLPVAVLLTSGEAHGCTAYHELIAEHDADPEALLAGRGSDCDAIRDDVRSRGGEPQIPTKKNRKLQHSANRASTDFPWH